MLDALRRAAGTWVAKLLMILLVVSFAAWGITGSIQGGLGTSVVTAGDTSVSALDYRLAYDRQVSVLSQQFGQRLTREQAAAFGIDDQVLAQLIAGAVLDEQARELRLGVSKDRIAALTAEDPAFRGPDGRFDRQAFQYVLSQVGMKPEDYFRNRGQVAVRQQVTEAITDGLKAPATFLKAVALYRGEDRTAEYLVLPKGLVEPMEEPAEAALTAWFEARKADYAAPEYRKLAYVKMEPEDLADESAVTDEQVMADYERNKARFTTPETRTIEQLVFKTGPEAQAALALIRGGGTFEQVITQQGKTPGDVLLGTLTKERVSDPAVAEAAFSLPANQVSEVVEGAFGPLLLRVTEIKPEVVRPLQEVASEIRRDLALAEASRVLLDVHDAYEDARAGGDTLRDAAAKQKLEVVTIDAVSRAGQRPDGTVIADLPESQKLLQAAFETDVNVENPAVPIGTSGYVFFEVEGITPARERPLAEVRDKAVADWKAAEAASRLSARAAELEKRLKDGTTLDAISAELKLEKLTKRGLKREADDAEFGKPGVAAVFSVAENGSGIVPAPNDGAQILFKVTEVFEPAGADGSAVDEQAKAAFGSGMADDLLDQLVARLQTEYEVSVDRNAMAQALSF